ncbi:unnamed protein product, partial [Onchocerca flexuosa]|uniref:Transcriptional protein SWT1 n=1 Tax=Onchocerca flexuosa TaxID=387005 RepID=A0A183H7E5_9BILA
ENNEKKKPKTIIPIVQTRKRSIPVSGKVKVRKRKRLREAISVSSASESSSSKSDERSELSEESSPSSSSTIKRKHQHRKKGIIEECKYYKKKGAGGTCNYYKETVIRKNDIRKCSHETKSDLLKSPELVEEVESYQRIRKYKKREQETTKRDEHFVEPDVDLPDLESVSSEEDQFSAQRHELKVQSAAKKSKSHRKILSTKRTRQQQSRHVNWRKKRIMEKRHKQCDNGSYRDRESSSLSENEKGHRCFSSHEGIDPSGRTGNKKFIDPYVRTRKHASNLHSPKNLQTVNLSDIVEAVTASSEESDDEEVGTSGIAHQPIAHVKNSLTKNESTQSLPTPFITSPEKLSGDSPLPCVLQSTPPAETSRSSFERRLENLFRSTSMQPPIIEIHEEERSNDAGSISVPFISGEYVVIFVFKLI